METTQPPELNLRGQFYFKGFGSVLQGMSTSIEIFGDTGSSPEEKTRHVAAANNALTVMLQCYDSIPFEQITKHPDYDLLVEIKRTLAQLPTALIRVLNEGANPDEAYNLIKIIHENGRHYRTRLTTIWYELRELPGQGNANLSSTCIITGKVWTSSAL
jgi:hypothetical protein